jgi:D-alanyl-D-alanine carboxypeptidase/D-alanyl-D-alanine-endopeptidase (penicillin-binding protein 4)
MRCLTAPLFILARYAVGWVACALFLAQAYATETKLPQPVAEALAQSGIPQTSIGLYVQEVDSKRPLLAFGEARALSPASVMKLVTTYAGLSLLGPAYTWNTEIYTDKAPRNGMLDGNLYIKGYGDPQLTLERFWLLLKDLRQRGVTDIHGDLVLDRSYFSVDGDPAQFDNKPDRPYNTLPDALMVNFKTISLHFVPDAVKHKVAIVVEPELPQARVLIMNDITLDETSPCGDWVERLPLEMQDDGAAARLYFSGKYALDCGEKERSYSVLDNAQYVYALFSQLWYELGGTFSGNVRNDSVPPTARLLTSYVSPPLAATIRDINKFSNNVMARQLFLTLGATHEALPGTADKAARTVKQWLDQKGLDFPELVLENGCGLSRNEHISAQSLGRILLDAYHSPVMPELMSSLPIVALDGTLRKRLTESAVAGRGHLKTGSLDGVRAIAGYLLDGQGRLIVVVLIVNDPKSDSAQAAQDALLQWVYSRP